MMKMEKYLRMISPLLPHTKPVLIPEWSAVMWVVRPRPPSSFKAIRALSTWGKYSGMEIEQAQLTIYRRWILWERQARRSQYVSR